MKILLAKSCCESQMRISDLLLKRGFDVILATDGAQAEAVLRKSDAPHMVVLDFVLPHTNGTEVCRRVRAKVREPYTYILLLISKQAPVNISKVVDAGADDWMFEPLEEHELLLRLHAGQRILQLQADLTRQR